MASCHYCPAPATTKDHVIPKALGGPNARWNIVPACVRCNQRKGARTYEEFTGRPQLPQHCRRKGFETTWAFVARRADWEALGADKRTMRKLVKAHRPRIEQHPAWVCVVPDE